MTTDRYAALRAALEAGPTPGPWYHDSDPIKGDPFGRVRYRVVALGRTIVQTYYSSAQPDAPFESGEPDNRFIAAADPETIAALLKERDALREAAMAMIEWDARENDHAVDFYARMDLYREAFDKARAAITLAAQERP